MYLTLKILWENYILILQTTSCFESSPLNYQLLDFGFQTTKKFQKD
jgi:hypothetical protein